MAKGTVQIDHVILLLPYKDLITPPDWVTQNFVISAGGKHADGKTENRLIFFQDGTYLELIAFIHDDPVKRKGHWWDTQYGIVDYALRTAEPVDHEGLRQKLKSSCTGVSYAKARRGGRTTPSGVSMTWEVTFPEGIARGLVPFWCEDITPRERRVPATDGNARHPCGAVGIAGIECVVASEQYKRVEGALNAIIRREMQSDGSYAVETPFDIGRLQSPTIRIKEHPEQSRLTLVLQSPRKKDGQKDIQERVGEGIVDVRFET